MENATKRRKLSNKGYKKKQGKFTLGTGVKGFLCSCNNREKECIRETYNILNKYADQLYGNQATSTKEVADSGTSAEDVENDFQKEIQELKRENEKRRFQVVDSGAKNFLFIRTTLENPVELAEAIVSHIFKTKEDQTRFLIRLVPVEITCRAYVDDVKKAFELLADKYFKDGPMTFSIVFNHRNNNNLSKDEVIKEIADVISKRNDHKVDLKIADFSVIVGVIKGIALLSVVPNYIRYKKYNLHSICQVGDTLADSPKNEKTDISDREATQSEETECKRKESSSADVEATGD